MNRRYMLLIVALIAWTGIVAAYHLNTRAGAEPGTLVVKSGDGIVQIDPYVLDLVTVEGTIVNGRGEERRIDARGIALSALLEAAGVTAEEKVTVVASDEYAAEIAADELAAEGRIWLIRTEDSWRLIVFGDGNARRDVKNVERIEVE